MRMMVRNSGGKTTVIAMAQHESKSYDDAKRKGGKANFITYMVGKLGNEVVYEVSMSQFISKNPFVKFSFMGGKKGDEVSITWTDLLGKTKTTTSKIR
jgi:sulfur-oxidizing protein SoxZ